MNVNFPRPTIRLDQEELREAVEEYLVRKGQIQGSGTFNSYHLGDAVSADLQPCRTLSQPFERLVGSITFELIKESE